MARRAKPTKQQTLTKWQKLAAQVYAGGDYAENETLEDTQCAGDGLYTFIQREIDPAEDCNSVDVALERIHTAIAELEVVKAALYAQRVRLK
ncbi:MAG: hypothetical protein NXH70_02265 [Hyphomonas sp.]|nr:hypothetical protein [Hyphomonas sp.]